MRFGAHASDTPPAGWFRPKERFWLIVMGAGALFLLGVLIFFKGTLESVDGDFPEAPPEEIVIAPRVDRARLAPLARDATPAERAVLEGPALEAAFEESSPLRDAVFAALGGTLLDATARAELLADPSEKRGAPYRVRGRVLDVQQLAASAVGNPRNLLRIESEDGSPVFLAAMLMPEGPPRVGDFLRFDGLFLKLFSSATEQGQVEGPLLVGPRTWRSFPAMQPVEQLTPELFAEVRDDDIVDGSSGLPTEPYWSLVSYVQHEGPKTIDWDAAPLLDNELIGKIFADGSDWRGVPVRIPVSMVLALWQEAQGENPLRLEKLTLGWLGHQPWVGQAKLVHFVSPFDFPSIEPRVDQATARAFFFKNLAYEPKDGGAAITPFFVVHSLEKYVATETSGLRQLVWVVAGLMVVTVFVIVALLRRDRARSRELQDDLLRRRRLRRARAST